MQLTLGVYTLPGTSTQRLLCGTSRNARLLAPQTLLSGRNGVLKGVFHSHFSHSLPMAVRPKKGQNTISMKVLTKRVRTSSR